MNKTRQVARYIIFDFFAAAISWATFYIYRKEVIEPQIFGIDIPLEFTQRFYLGLLFVPTFWILFYYVTGFYKNIFRRSRLIELGQTLLTSIIGVVFIFFTQILDDFIKSYINYYQLFFTLLTLHFFLTYFFRLVLTTGTLRKIRKRKIGFNTLLIGSNDKAVKIFNEMTKMVRTPGNKFVGFIRVENNNDSLLSEYIPKLGDIKDLEKVITEQNIEEIIIALETTEHARLSEILTIVENRQITIWGIPDLYDFLSGMVKINTIFSSPLIKISNGLMPGWQENVKRLLDVSVSVLAILIFFPVFLTLAILIKATSKGPVFYSQERVGRFGKPFTIIKFRSMVVDAECNGPALSGDEDERLTPIGNFLRKTHLDEIPQFYNVIIGDMSLVGPRPERRFFINQIIKRAPYYTHLHKLRPGITSWGQVKYGYASNVDEMLERLQYDMIYLKNISLYVDFKILIYTVIICFKGKGRIKTNL
jgi:exopolysaccharide biosynthesis polyprenyl glycosylphosphotransferase